MRAERERRVESGFCRQQGFGCRCHCQGVVLREWPIKTAGQECLSIL